MRTYGIKLEEKNYGALIKQKNTIREKLSYRVINVGEQWNYSSDWQKFFFKLGRFVQQIENINIFVNYINRTISSTLISMGIIDEFYQELSKNDYENNFNDFVAGDEISYLNDDGEWYRAKVLEVIELTSMPEKFSPYLKISGIFKREETTIYVPRNQWSTRIRLGGVVAGSPGRSQKVSLNDRISEVISLRYNEKLVNWLKMHSKINVNLIGWGIDKKVRDFRNKIQFSDKSGSFLITDLLYLDNDKESNYTNVHVVSSDMTDVNPDPSSVSVFVGAKNSLKFHKHKSKRNIYLTSRIRKEYYDDTQILINHLFQSSLLTKQEREDILYQLKAYLNQFNLDIPKGVEIYVF